MPTQRVKLVLLSLGLSLALSARAETAADPVLDVLASEAKRATAALDTGETPLYYLSYRVSDGVQREIRASYGALLTSLPDDSETGRVRQLDVTARVGSPSLDSTHKLREEGFEFDPDDFARGGTRLPFGDDPGALKLAVWKATAHAYEKAAQKLIRVRTNKQVKVSEEDAAADFTAEPPQTFLGVAKERVPPRGAQDVWAERVKRLSALFKKYPHVLSSQVMFENSVWTNYFADSDGAQIREPQSYARLMILASVKADD